ncbi:MAG: DinB family protein [Bacteroidota bacterium]|nr:DinB family protein [Bacteroidota bacterium]
MPIDAFNATLDLWINELNNYDFETLCRKPSISGWSLGHVYMHLIENSQFCIEQINKCIQINEHADMEASPHGKEMLSHNEFPDETIEGPPTNLLTPQPSGKEEVLESLQQIRSEINALANQPELNNSIGKSKHPGLSYLNAREWLQFAQMHLRHHLRQKKRIDAFLKMD